MPVDDRRKVLCRTAFRVHGRYGFKHHGGTGPMLLTAAAVATIAVVLSPGSTASPPRAHRLVRMTAVPGGDLSNGDNAERNAALSAIRRSFLAVSEEVPPSEKLLPRTPVVATRDAARVGVHLDLPATRWSVAMLPHHRTVLNVFQPQYTLLFEKLLAQPQPWLCAPLQLPGQPGGLVSHAAL